MTDSQPQQPQEEPLPDEILNASAEDIVARTRLIDNDLKVSPPLPLRSIGSVIPLSLARSHSPTPRSCAARRCA